MVDFYLAILLFLQANYIISDTLEPGLSRTYLISYKNSSNFTFEIKEEDIININIHSINCNFKLYFDGEIINQINLNTYSLEINSSNTNKTLTLTPVFDVIDGVYKENYEQKICPISINSYSIKDKMPKLRIENKELNTFYLVPSKYESLNLLYEIKEVKDDSFVALSFLFHENSHLLIEINWHNKNNQQNNITKYIDNSTYIFLNSEFLLFENSEINSSGGNLSIRIINKDDKVLNMNFKIIEKDTVSILEKDALNYGFLTSRTTYQYYYTEIFQGEEGEIMLHNKFLYGVLHAKIINKDKITDQNQLNDPSIYPNETLNETNSTSLIYNPHILKLNYSCEDTMECMNGCYLLITYEQKKSEMDFPLIGYEFTILSRTWNYTDYISQIIDIPFNEYIIGNFDGSITSHYYSIFIPNDADKIFIQIEGNYIAGFYEEGRKKISTIKIMKNTRSLEIINNKNILTLDIKELNYKNKTISFAFRPKDFFVDVYSFYYFRVLYKKENQKLYLPIDSHFGNLCLPEKEDDDTDNSFYCNLIFKDNYNILSTYFAISSSIQNEYFEIHVSKIYSNGTIEEKKEKIIYNETGITKDFDYYIFRFQFKNNETKNILTSFYDKVPETFPQIYSPQMVYLYQIKKINYFKLKNTYTLNYKYIYGDPLNSNAMEINFRNLKKIYSSRNFRGKPIAIQIDSSTPNITHSNNKQQSIFFFQLIYNMRNKGIEEIKSGDATSRIMVGGHFPLYYYLKIKNESYININVNLRLNSFNETELQNNFDIYGYLLDEDSIKRKINGEYIKLDNPIKGYYSDAYKVGLLQVNQEYNGYNYLLIEIRNNDQAYITSYLLVELVTKEYNPEPYVLPINQYILETFSGFNNSIRKENKYYLDSSLKMIDQAFIEISPSFDDINIEFEKSKHTILMHSDAYNGFKKYWVNYSDNDDVYFSVCNKNQRNANYMIRYFFYGLGDENVYNIDFNPKKEIDYSKSKDGFVDVSLTFKDITIFHLNKIVKDQYVYFTIFGNLFYNEGNSDEYVNTTCILTERKFLYTSQVIRRYNHSNLGEWTLTFKDISRKDNYEYELQLLINMINEGALFDEEFLTYKTKVDLKEIGIKEEEKNNLGLILGCVFGSIGGVLIIFFIIKYIRLKKKNTNLQENLKSWAFSNDVQKNIFVKEKQNIKDTDYDSTFI